MGGGEFNNQVGTREMSSVHTVCVVPRRPRGDAKKCRKVYGMNHREQWCTQCKWKKACTRFGENNWDKQQNQNYFNDESIQTESVMKRLCMQNWENDWIERQGTQIWIVFKLVTPIYCGVLSNLEGVSSNWKLPLVPSLILPWRKERVKKAALILMKNS